MLARRTGTSRQAVSQLVQSIEEAGLVERLPHPGDRRSVVVRHTDAGRQILLDALDVMSEIEADYAGLIGASDAAELKRLLAGCSPRSTRRPARHRSRPDRGSSAGSPKLANSRASRIP